MFRFVLQNIKIVPSFMTREYDLDLYIWFVRWQLTSLVPLVARIEQKWLLTSNDKGTSSQQTIPENVRIRPLKMNASPLLKESS